MVETKARADLADAEVQAKADAAAKWCQYAQDYAQSNGGKPWQYLIIPHDEINESRRLEDYERFVKK
jgi:type III restriction enzyme